MLRELSSLVDAQETTLLGEGSSLHAKLSLHTVPLLLFEGPAVMGREKVAASAVLLRVGRRSLLLTSGTVAQAASGEVLLPSSRVGEPRVLASVSSVSDAEADAGVLSISAPDAAALEGGGRAFLDLRSLELSPRDDALWRRDWLVLGGYRGDVGARAGRTWRGARLRGTSTMVAREGLSPPCSLPPMPNGVRALDLFLHQRGRQSRDDGESGSGCWRTGMRVSTGTWTPAALRLLGVCTSLAERAEGVRFVRVTLVEHHLRLIARTFPDVGPKLVERWPELQRSGV